MYNACPKRKKIGKITYFLFIILKGKTFLIAKLRGQITQKTKKWKYEIKSRGKKTNSPQCVLWACMDVHVCAPKWSLFCMKMYSIHVWMVLVALVFCVSASFFNLPFFKKWGKNKFRNNFLSSIHSSSIFCMNDANSSLEMNFCLMMKHSGKLLLFSLQLHVLLIYMYMIKNVTIESFIGERSNVQFLTKPYHGSILWIWIL